MSIQNQQTDDCEASAEDSVRGNPVAESKYLRQQLDSTLQQLRSFSERDFKGLRPPGFAVRSSRERSIVITKIQEAIMWLGMDLKAINEAHEGAAPNPYPDSYDPKSPVIAPTSEGLKL